MRVAKILIIVLSSFVLGCGQTTTGWKWRDANSDSSRLQASFPCESAPTVKSFQDEPRPIKVHSFSCEIDGFRFLISVKNHMNEFGPNTVAGAFDSNEFLLKNMYGDVEKFVVQETVTPEGFPSREYDTRLKDGGRIRSLFVVNEFAMYEALVGVTPDALKNTSAKKLDFDSIADRFLKSVQVKK